jgi:mRNA-degrading endonuclease toxin of MazEF toxin-antitoxin module
VTTLDRAKLADRLGALPSDLLGQVEDGLRAALDLESTTARGPAA